MAEIGLEFRLSFATRRDDAADVFVGYCPALDVYSQGRSREEAEDAVVDAAQLFIVSCYERDILHTVLRNRGMTKAKPGSVASEDHQYIKIANFDKTFERSIPVNLLNTLMQESELCPLH
jgi:predicted RNase H-like HicB family nuclease